MAKKSKGFGELLKRERHSNVQQESMSELAQRVKQSLKGRVIDVVANPEGEVKMSAVLETLVDPYLDVAANLEQRQKLFAIAILAWNLALLPVEEQRSQMEQMIEQIVGGQGRQTERDTREILEDLLERKQRLFPNLQRFILDFNMRETRDEFFLSVVSSVIPRDSD